MDRWYDLVVNLRQPSSHHLAGTVTGRCGNRGYRLRLSGPELTYSYIEVLKQIGDGRAARDRYAAERNPENQNRLEQHVAVRTRSCLTISSKVPLLTGCELSKNFREQYLETLVLGFFVYIS